MRKLSKSISISLILVRNSKSACFNRVAFSGSRSIRSSISLAVVFLGRFKVFVTIDKAIPASGDPAAEAIVGARLLNNDPSFIQTSIIKVDFGGLSILSLENGLIPRWSIVKPNACCIFSEIELIF